MHMKKYLIYLLSVLFIPPLFLFFIINILIDPYGENYIFKTSFNQYKIFSKPSAASHLLDLLEKNKYALVFGTSRIGLIDANATGEPTLNFRNSVYGYPSDVYKLLSMLNDQQIKNISKIYYLIDTHALKSSDQDFYSSKSKLESAAISNINLEKILIINVF